jgi:hypothetical protein
MVEYQLSRKIKILKFDGGGEYISIEFNLFFEENGINRKYIIPNIIEQNDVSKRNNRTLISYAILF